jgi:hypothetical protein
MDAVRIPFANAHSHQAHLRLGCASWRGLNSGFWLRSPLTSMRVAVPAHDVSSVGMLCAPSRRNATSLRSEKPLLCRKRNVSAIRKGSWAPSSDLPEYLFPLEHKNMYANISLILCGSCGIVQDIENWV